MDTTSSKLSELSSRISTIGKELFAEEEKLKAGISLSSAHLQEIKDRVSFLRRKYTLYKQAEQMRSKSSGK